MLQALRELLLRGLKQLELELELGLRLWMRLERARLLEQSPTAQQQLSPLEGVGHRRRFSTASLA